MPEFQRVKDKTTGHEYSTRYPNPKKVDVIEKPAVDRNGRPLPAKPKTTVGQEAAAKKKTPSGGEPAEIPEEGSK